MDPRIANLNVISQLAPHDDYEVVHFPTDEIRLRITNAGDIQVTEYTSADRDGPPPHTHPWHEVSYVIDGAAEFFVDGRWQRVTAGASQVLPAGTPHSVRVPAGAVKILMVTVGAPYDQFGRDLAALYAEGATMDGVVAVATRHGLALA